MKEGELYTGQLLPNGWTTKTNGKCEEIIVHDPNFYNLEDKKIKIRRKPTNITPKKKCRK